jgi:hypothetical protein
MEKWRIDFPEVDIADIAFGGYPEDWFQTILTIDCSQKYKDMASSLFFNGGKVPVNKELPEDYRIRGLRILKAVMGSFAPKHEHKEQVCGTILKSLCHKDEETK